jgi:hypothetical protein
MDMNRVKSELFSTFVSALRVCFLYELKPIKEVVITSMHGEELDSNVIVYDLVILATVIIGIYNQYIRYNGVNSIVTQNVVPPWPSLVDACHRYFRVPQNRWFF